MVWWMYLNYCSEVRIISEIRECSQNIKNLLKELHPLKRKKNSSMKMDSELPITQKSSASSVSTIITPSEIELHYTITLQ